jgi:diguanylate cyclase
MTEASVQPAAERERPATAARWFALTGGAWTLAHVTGLLGPLMPATFLLLMAAAAAANVVGVRRNRPTQRWPWRYNLIAFVLFFLGGGLRQALGTLGDLSVHRSLLPDALTLPGYLVLAVGLLGIGGTDTSRAADRSILLDGAIGGLAALALWWTFLISPSLSHQSVPLRVEVLLVAYPAASVAMLVMTLRLAFVVDSRRVPAARFLMGALASLCVGDVLYSVRDAGLAAIPLNLLDAPYALAFVCSGALALHPTMALLSDRRPARQGAVARSRLGLLAVALLIPAVVTLTSPRLDTRDRLALVVITAGLIVAVIARFVLVLHAHARFASELAYHADHDSLTGLANRSVVRDRLTAALARAEQAGEPVALLHLDLDRFQLVNDTYGHSLGDELLRAVGDRLRGLVRAEDLLARTGGDEFALVLGGVGGPAAVEVAERLRAALLAPFDIRGCEIMPSVSVGIVVVHGPVGIDAETVIRNADAALHHAKAAGRDNVALFDDSMQHRAAERLLIERDLRHAIDHGELAVHYQPLLELEGRSIHGVEALVRWTHPTLGSITPVRFIPVAEETGLIGEIGAWVLREACRQVAEWRRDLPVAANLKVSVNLSVRQLRDPNLVGAVRATLAETGLPGFALCLEVTESQLMDNVEAAAETFRQLRSMGVTLAVDDFGTGYSSLAYLERFPMSFVKIDRAFVARLGDDQESSSGLVAAIVAMAGALGMVTVAEGVETEAQERRLAELGCPVVQGFLYARPLPASDLPAWLEALAVVKQAA